MSLLYQMLFSMSILSQTDQEFLKARDGQKTKSYNNSTGPNNAAISMPKMIFFTLRLV